jgi:hypothetical protein
MAAIGLTVTVATAAQPDPRVNEIIAVPALTPLTTPVAEPIVAMAISLDVQMPLPTSVSAVVAPLHTLSVPVMGDNTEVLTKAVARQLPTV